MTETPYQIQLDDLPITVEYTKINMPNFVEHLSDFSDGTDGTMHMQGIWHDRHMRNAASFSVRIIYWGDDTTQQYLNLEFIGKFSINKYGAVELPYLAEKFSAYCYKLINNYVEEHGVLDKNKMLYPIPKFKFYESEWATLAFDLP